MKWKSVFHRREVLLQASVDYHRLENCKNFGLFLRKVEKYAKIISTRRGLRYLKNCGAWQRRDFWHIWSCIGPAHVMKILDPGHSRSGYQVTLSGIALSKVTMSATDTQKSRSLIKSMYKVFISEFSYRWPKDRSILWRPHYRSMNGRRLKCASLGRMPLWTLSNT